MESLQNLVESLQTKQQGARIYQKYCYFIQNTYTAETVPLTCQGIAIVSA